MTEYEADLKIKLLKGPFAYVCDRAKDEDWKGVPPRYYVGWSPCYGNGDTWEEAFADLKRNRDHIGLQPVRTAKYTHKCAKCRAPKEVLKRGSMRYD
jgi:hypothetical protein